MPKTEINGVNLYYEDTGTGTPIVFVHEFAGDYRSWELQVRHFSRRYRCIVYNARGYPPSDVPEQVQAYSQDIAVQDLLGVLDHLKLEQAHVVGFSMGGFAALIFELRHPRRCRSLVIAGCGYGSDTDRSKWERDVDLVADRFEHDGMAKAADFYARGPTRVQFIDKDPRGWQEFYEQLKASSSIGHAMTMRGVQKRRPSVPQLEAELRKLTVPTLVITGDEDEPCLEPGLFMKRAIPSAALVVMPQAGHTINLEDPDAFNAHLETFFAQVDAGRWRQRNPASRAASAILPPEEERR
jgi:pimeloyl-ACP methyl ester carboxylesterase